MKDQGTTMAWRVTDKGLPTAAATLLGDEFGGITAHELHRAIREHRQRKVENRGDRREHREAVTIRETARRLACSPRSVWRMISAGEIRAVRNGRRVTRIPSQELDRAPRVCRAALARRIVNAQDALASHRRYDGGHRQEAEGGSEPGGSHRG